jgi:hypothetical protein
MEVTETEEVTSGSLGKLELSDTKATGGASTIACEEEGRGWIGANGRDEEIEVRLTKCVRVEGVCETNVRAAGVNLPWSTQLEIVAGQIRDRIESATGKGPNYVFECLAGGVFKVKDECFSPISTRIANLSNGNVVTEFDKGSEEEEIASSACSIGGPGSLRVRGVDDIQQRKEVATYVNIR